MSNRIRVLWLFSAILCACGNNSGAFKTVQQQQAGDYTLTVLSETGAVKNGTSDFILEFRRTADNQLADVSPVEVSPIMEMPGMGPMIGTTTIMPADMPGRYRVTSNLSMAGMWRFNVKFGAGETARININAE
jgi:hypothetical protein